MADTKRYASVPVLTLADDLSSSGAYIKTTTANDWGGNALTTADFNTDYIPATIINDAKTLVEFILIDATTIGNLTTTGALIYKRGLKYYAEGDTTDSDEVTANKLAWTQGESKLLIGTNPPWMYGKFPSKENDETITGLWTFPASGSANVAVVASATNPPLLDAELATKKYVDDTAIAGAPDATTTVKGIVEIATQAEVDAGTTTGATGASLAVRPPELANVIQDGSYVYAADSVGTDAYAITLVPAITAYVTGQVFHFKAGTANTGASTLNVNALGAKTLKYANDRDTVTGDIEVGSIVTVAYDGTNFQILSISAGTIVTDLAGQLNTGYSANVTGTNLATLTASTTSNADALHTHTNFTDYSVNTLLFNDWYTFQAGSPKDWSVAAFTGVSANGNSMLYSAYTGANTAVKAVEMLPSSYGTLGGRSGGSTSLTRFKWRCGTPSTASVGAIGFTASSTTGIYDVRTSVNIGVRFVFDLNAVYASVGTGAANSNTLLTAIAANVWHTYEMIWTSTTSVDFYVDGVLMHTQSSGLPTPAELQYFAFGVNSAGDGSTPQFRAVGSPVISIKTAA